MVDFEHMAGIARRSAIGGLGTTVVYSPTVGDPFDLRGVWTEEYELLEGSGETAISTTTPALGVDVTDIPGGPNVGETLTKGGKTYEVRDMLTDGMGGKELILQEVSP